MIIKNADACIIINREIDSSGDIEKIYMGFKLEKFRGKPSKDRVNVFLHPFDVNNGICLIPDIYRDDPLSRIRMEDFNAFSNDKLQAKGKIEVDPYDKRDSILLADLSSLIDEDYRGNMDEIIPVIEKAESMQIKADYAYQRDIEFNKEFKEKIKKKKHNNEDGIVYLYMNYELDKDGTIKIHRIRD